MLGSILALISAMMFALNTTTLRRGVLSAPVHQAIAITVPLGMPLFLSFFCYLIALILSWIYQSGRYHSFQLQV